MDILKKLAVGVISLAGGFCIMFALWALMTGRTIQIDLTDISVIAFWLFFSLPVYAFLNKKLLSKRRR